MTVVISGSISVSLLYEPPFNAYREPSVDLLLLAFVRKMASSAANVKKEVDIVGRENMKKTKKKNLRAGQSEYTEKEKAEVLRIPSDVWQWLVLLRLRPS